MSRPHLRTLLARRAKSETAHLHQVEHNRHMIGQYDEVEMLERNAYSAFRLGYARGSHWNMLADCRNILMLAVRYKLAIGAAKADHEAIREVTRIAMHALTSIRDREQKTGRFGCNAEELNALHALVESSRDFWNRQPAELFRQAVEANRAQLKEQVVERGAVA